MEPTAERDALEGERWCDECGELGWEGICPACHAFAVREAQPAL
jgi:hypothetical protein